MTDTRIYVLVGAFLIGATTPSAASEGGDGKYNGAVQRSIYDVVRGEYLRGYEPILQTGRAATAEPLPSAQSHEEPEYMRREADYVQGQ